MAASAEKSEIPLLEDYIRLNKINLLILGLWPIPEVAPKWRQALQFFHTAVVFILFSMLFFPAIIDLYMFKGDVGVIADNLCTTMTMFSVITYIPYFTLRRKTLKAILRNMESNWNRSMDLTAPKTHRDILLRAAEFSKAFTRWYSFIIYVTCSLYMFSPLFILGDLETQTARRQPVRAWYPINQTSEVIYTAIYASQVVGGAISSIGSVSVDGLFLVMMRHFCAQLRILQCELTTLGTSVANCESNSFTAHFRMNKTTTDVELLQRIKNIIEDHQSAIQNADNIRSLYNVVCFLQLFVSSVVICVIGFQLIFYLDSWGLDLVKYVMYIQAVLLQIYIYCSLGDDLLTESIRVGQAAYECPWTNFSTSVKSCLLVMTMRSQQPLLITAGNFYVMSMENFAAILKTSLSYLSVLRAMCDDGLSE
ncbi:odorant receptor 13a isoform X1 [Neodiprion pinetum]|uniref:odorant receptor 13a isoform X1 n=1 Tax=Neodiprion pinetum TaxID=441929 RepID=UPI001EE06510|nr:odorant receptor 13a-like isoform X1 [Neodiprion pinetum]XP_046478014.1 odorant receptor 13a-like isoform X1 [Neodiprion pinetum]